MILTNFGYLVIRTPLREYVPQFFALPFGMIFLFGPLFYFYAKSVIDVSFKWRKIYWLHFTPYLVQVLINLPLFVAGLQFWNLFIDTFLAGNLIIRSVEKIIFAVQDAHLLVYLLLTFRWINRIKKNPGNSQFIISVFSRISWLKQLTVCFSLFLLTVFSLYIFILFRGTYKPITNYTYTLVTSVIIYFIAYKLVLQPELISPDFIRKYRAYMQFKGEDANRYLQKLQTLMNEAKIFVDADLKLSSLAAEIGLPAHQLSKLINEKFGKTYNDYINEHRVNEFIKRINDNESQSYTIYGIALDVGFNSKSSFNTAFKKITGKTPSQFKPAK